jgi:hypothetical protein
MWKKDEKTLKILLSNTSANFRTQEPGGNRSMIKTKSKISCQTPFKYGILDHTSDTSDTKLVLQIHGPNTIKTPKLKGRLHWCLVEFTDRATVSHVGIFDPSCELAPPQTFSLVHLPPPFPVWISTGHVFNCTVCHSSGRGSGCVESIFRSYTLCIWPDSEPTKLLYRPKKNLGGEGASDRYINSCRQVPL